MKNKGFSLIELVVVVSITLVSIHGISQIYSNILIKKEVEKETIKIISLLRRSQIESSEKKILAGNEVIELNKNYEYMFNSNNDKKYLEIEFNENHNASKAFSIFISKKNKVLKRISFDTINAAKYPIIRVYDV